MKRKHHKIYETMKNYKILIKSNNLIFSVSKNLNINSSLCHFLNKCTVKD